jgi:hypothetical protein
MKVKGDANIIAVAKVIPEDPEELLALAEKKKEKETKEKKDENDNQVSMDTE